MPSSRRAFLGLLVGAAVLAAGCAASPESPALEADASEPGAGSRPGSTQGPTSGSGSTPTDTTVVVHRAEGPAVAAPAPEPVAVRGGEFFLGAVSYEPTLGVDPDGAIFMTADTEGIVVSAPTLKRSVDKGRTWEDAGPRLPTGHPAHPTSFDPFVHVDRDTGRVFMDDIVPLGCGTLSYSDDQGATWTTNRLSCGNPQVNDHQSLATGKPRKLSTLDYPNVVYRCVNNVAYAACAMSLDGGRTFTPQTVAYDVARELDCAAITGHLETDPEGRVFLPYGGCSGGPKVAVSEDDGLTWTTHRISAKHPSEAGSHDVSLAADEAGNLFALWTHKRQAWLSHSLDHGKTWSEPRMVSAPGVTAVTFMALDAAGPGKVALAYYGTTAEGGYEARESGDADWKDVQWNLYLAVSEDALSDAPTFMTVTANDPADPIARGQCDGDGRCHGVGDFIDLEIDGEGRPWAAMVDVCNAKCAKDPDVLSDGAQGAVGTLLAGPSLLAAGGLLPTLDPPPTAGA